MSTNNESSDEFLGRILDDVCEELKAGKEVDSKQLKCLHPGYADEWPQLLDAITQLHSAALEWRGTGTLTPDHLGGSQPSTFLIPAPNPERIGRYEVLSLIGRGGMGAVYKARDPELDREVAI